MQNIDETSSLLDVLKLASHYYGFMAKEIIKKNPEITDQELLNLAGGIVQGMSGSPIIQGEYIVGAVTHVVIENPRKGYGIFIVNMLEEAEN